MSHESIALAKKLLEQEGRGELTVENFDKFIIDNGMASDPGTDDPKDPAYKGFVQERASAKRTLNSAATSLQDEAFAISVKTPGKTYEIVSWSASADVTLGNTGAAVRRHAENKVASLKTMRNKAERLMKENPHEGAFAEAFQALAVVESEAKMLGARVDALTLHFDKGVEAAREYAKGRMAEAASDNVVRIEGKTA